MVTLFLLTRNRSCDPAGIQTQDLQNRNLTLYSAKLQGLLVGMRMSQRLPLCGIGRLRFLLLTRAHVALVILRSYDLFYYYALVAMTAALRIQINRDDLLRKWIYNIPMFLMKRGLQLRRYMLRYEERLPP